MHNINYIAKTLQNVIFKSNTVKNLPIFFSKMVDFCTIRLARASNSDIYRNEYITHAWCWCDPQEQLWGALGNRCALGLPLLLKLFTHYLGIYEHKELN